MRVRLLIALNILCEMCDEDGLFEMFMLGVPPCFFSVYMCILVGEFITEPISTGGLRGTWGSFFIFLG